MLIIDADGTRVSRVPSSNLAATPAAGGGWIVEFDGSSSGLGPLPAILGNSKGEIEIQAAPGVILSSSLGGGVSCRLPDGSKFLTQLPAAAYVPSSITSNVPSPQTLKASLEVVIGAHEASKAAAQAENQEAPPVEGDQPEGQAPPIPAVADGSGVAAEDFDLASALSSRSEFSSCMVLDLIQGRACLTPPPSERHGLAFKVGPKLASLEYWPEPQPTEWLEYPQGCSPEEIEAQHARAVAEAAENDMPPPAPPQGPAPIRRAVPVAPSVIPRIFAIFPLASGGGGYEILEPQALQK